MVSTVTPFLVTAVSLYVYSLVAGGDSLTQEKAFVSLALINMLQLPISLLPMVISLLVGVCSVSFILHENKIVRFVVIVVIKDFGCFLIECFFVRLNFLSKYLN